MKFGTRILEREDPGAPEFEAAASACQENQHPIIKEVRYLKNSIE